jgi:hypothetical protein
MSVHAESLLVADEASSESPGFVGLVDASHVDRSIDPHEG